ncbi:DNA oxidative demethylase ALKBH2 isoform X1 [Hippocampus zosterae]|uniref:DNA oxidative demethylase ALKBH2 isoform X1 n=2 Tax=Hippocampus zosterae TaxID=109293 RepID=UPI00223CC489|nr:DNA oxidative demethylase ALKBH2 isoform X1 [Hippocampus zosterae]
MIGFGVTVINSKQHITIRCNILNAMEKFVRKQSCPDDTEITPSMKIKPEEIEGKEEAADAEEDDFSDPIPWQKIESEGLDCDYALLFTQHEADHLFQKLEKEVVYSTGDEAKVQVFGKVYDIPRKQATYGDTGLIYTYSGVSRLACPWTPTLEYIRDSVTKVTGHRFNFVLINRYEDGQDHIGEHRDDERELDPLSPIASVSFGAARDFVFRHRDARGKRSSRRIEPVKLVLSHGSLLLMNSPTNTFWYHSLPVRKKVLLPRINLTFRRIMSTGK